MIPVVKYTLGRLGLFLAVLLAVWFTPLDLLLKLLVALVVSFALSWFLLRPWRVQMEQSLAAAVDRRRARRERLRAALAGEDDPESREDGQRSGSAPAGSGEEG
jgi:hypothetical protein